MSNQVWKEKAPRSVPTCAYTSKTVHTQAGGYGQQQQQPYNPQQVVCVMAQAHRPSHSTPSRLAPTQTYAQPSANAPSYSTGGYSNQPPVANNPPYGAPTGGYAPPTGGYGMQQGIPSQQQQPPQQQQQPPQQQQYGMHMQPQQQPQQSTMQAPPTQQQAPPALSPASLQAMLPELASAVAAVTGNAPPLGAPTQPQYNTQQQYTSGAGAPNTGYAPPSTGTAAQGSFGGPAPQGSTYAAPGGYQGGGGGGGYQVGSVPQQGQGAASMYGMPPQQQPPMQQQQQQPMSSYSQPPAQQQKYGASAVQTQAGGFSSVYQPQQPMSMPMQQQTQPMPSQQMQQPPPQQQGGYSGAYNGGQVRLCVCNTRVCCGCGDVCVYMVCVYMITICTMEVLQGLVLGHALVCSACAPGWGLKQLQQCKQPQQQQRQ